MMPLNEWSYGGRVRRLVNLNPVGFFCCWGVAQILMDPEGQRSGVNQPRDTAKRQAQEGIEMYHFITKIFTKMKIVSQKGNYPSPPAEQGGGWGRRGQAVCFLAYLGPVGKYENRTNLKMADVTLRNLKRTRSLKTQPPLLECSIRVPFQSY